MRNYQELKKAARAIAVGATLAATPTVGHAQPSSAAQAAPSKYIVIKDQTRATETPEQRQMVDNISRDFRAANISLPALFAPFPKYDIPKLGGQGMYKYNQRAREIGHYDSLQGMAENGMEQRMFQSPSAFAGSCKGLITASPQMLAQTRNMVLAHELGHKLDHDLKLTQGLQDKIGGQRFSKADNPDGKLGQRLRSNISERLADATAELYTLGNQKNPWPVVKAQYDQRIVGGVGNAEHNTASTLRLAAQEYSAHPRPGLSIVEASRWAAQIVSKQANAILPEYRLNQQFGNYLLNRKKNPALETGQMKQMTKDAFNASDRLCGIAPQSSLKLSSFAP